MNKKILRLFQPGMQLYFIFLILFAVATFFYGTQSRFLAIIEISIIILLYIFSSISSKKRSQKLLKYIESVTYNINSATKDTLINFPLPMVILNLNDNEIIWSNDNFLKMTGEREHFFEVRLTDSIPDFSSKWLLEGKSEFPGLITINDKKYKVFGNIVRSEQEPGIRGYLATTYWIDVTDFAHMREEYLSSRPISAIIMLDNYDELLKNVSDKDKSALMSVIDSKISDWVGDCGGYLSKYDRDRYIFLFEERYLKGFVNNRFSILDSVREVVSPGGVQATLSIGIGKDGHSLAESVQFASLSIEMALSRGGDQAVIKNQYNFEFYGGHSIELERRTKVKSRVMANAIGELMSDASKIFIMGHKSADLDSIGSAVGLCCAARKLGKTVRIVIDMERNSAMSLISRISRLPEYENVFMTPEDAILEADGRSFLIVVDTNRPEQVESTELLLSCNRIAVIDHHRRAANYIQDTAINFHEPYASSASELVAELLQYMVDQADILRYEAEALLAGIVLDTKNFTLRTGGRTFDAAAFLRRAGADTTEVKKLLQTDIQTAMARYAIIQKARIYKAGIAICAPDTQEDKIIAAQAADELLNISGIQASFVIYPDDAMICISARSIGDINVQVILEKLGGGGNKSTAGAQIKDKSQKEVIQKLIAVIDEYLSDND